MTIRERGKIADRTDRLRSVQYHWQVNPPRPAEEGRLAQQLNISPIVARMLIQRGLGDPDEASTFLNPRLEDLHDPSLLADLDRVVERIFEARRRREKILIYGDYDVDGITSTVVLRRALEILGIEAGFHIPRRLEDGYGLRTEVIRKAVDDGYRLIITADSGVRAFQVCDYACTLGVDLIVTDHHLPDQQLPSAFAIINPKRPDCSYPDKNLAAVGVIFKLVQALFRREGKERLIPHFLKMVAIGTIADLVPLTGENRIITRHGLAALSDPRNVGLRALLEGAGVGADVTHFDVGFKVAPRMNAVTRMGGGREVVDLFSITDEEMAMRMVDEMNSKNLQRREEENQILEEILERYESDPTPFDRRFLLVSGRDWHRGVIGIVASRLVERFYRPVLVLSVGEEICQGSGRSIPGFHLLDSLEACRDLLGRFGGHAQAVGCSIEPEICSEEHIQRLAERLEKYAAEHLSEEDLRPRLQIDSLLDPAEIDFSLYHQVQQLAPFGMANPVPVFASTSLKIAGGPWVLKEKHLKMKVQCNGAALDALWWRHGDHAESIATSNEVEAAYTLDRQFFRGEEQLQLVVRDLRTPAQGSLS